MGQPLLEVHPERDRAAELGIDTGSRVYTLWAYSDGAFEDEFFIDDDEIDTFLYSTEGNIERPGDLESIMFYSRRGGVVPLSGIATLRETVNTETIRRVDGDRTITLSIIPPRDAPLGGRGAEGDQGDHRRYEGSRRVAVRDNARTQWWQ